MLIRRLCEKKIVEAMNAERTSDIAGPEQLRTSLAQMHPRAYTELHDEDQIVQNFVLRLYTEGSGTQVFSTTFVQWAGREILRRARPQTLVLRFRPRQLERPIDELLVADHPKPSNDPSGSLMDADMGAYYTWINLQRLPGADASRFVVCFENGSKALAVGQVFLKEQLLIQSVRCRTFCLDGVITRRPSGKRIIASFVFASIRPDTAHKWCVIWSLLAESDNGGGELKAFVVNAPGAD
jgi:hypothetical protein